VLLGDNAGVTTLWDPTDRTSRILLPGRRRKSVTAVAFNRDGTRCASGGYDGDVIVWDVRSGQVLWECPLDYYVMCLAFLGDGDRLLTGTAAPNSTLRMWELVRDGAKELSLQARDSRRESAQDLIVSPRGDRFVSITSTNRCLLWDAATGRVLANLYEEAEADPPQEEPARPRAAFSTDGSRLAIIGASLSLRDGRTGATIQQVDAGRWERVHCVGFSDDGGIRLVVDAGRASVLRRGTPDRKIWDDIPLDRPGKPSDVTAFLGRGLILAGHDARTLRLLEPPPLALAHADLGSDIGLAQVVVSRDGSRIATLTRPRWTPRPGHLIPTAEEMDRLTTSRLQVWEWQRNSRTLQPLSQAAERPGGHDALVIAYSPKSDTLAVGCRAEGGQAPVLLGTPTRDGDIKFDHLGVHTSDVWTLAFTPDGKRLIAGNAALEGGPSAELICWTLGGRSGPDWRTPFPAGVTAIAASRERIVVGGTDGVLRLLPMERPSETLAAVDLGDDITGVAFASAGSLVVVVQLSGRVRVFDVSATSFAPRTQFDQPKAACSAVVLDPTHDILYVRGHGGVQRWDVHVWQPIDPVIPFVGDVKDFNLTSCPEAVIAVTSKGQLIRRTISNPEPENGVVGVPQPAPVHPR
jgi:WD40 repeat protein